MKRILKQVGVVLAAMVMATTMGAVPAQAANYGWVYISLPTWLGNCPQGGKVMDLHVMVGDTWSGGDSGDDLVYAKVRLGEKQTVVAQGICHGGSPRPVYAGPSSSNTIEPTRNNQTWWVGPGGTSHN